MEKKYIPKQGDLIYIDSNPVIVISNNIFNEHTNRIIICPISLNSNDYPTHYNLEDSKMIKGYALCEYLRSIDCSKSDVKFIEKASDNDLLSVIMLTNACIEG